jgi:riboflavin synthase
MFTGIIEHTGTIQTIEKKAHGIRIQINTAGSPLSLKEGGSIAINGVCLTVTHFRDVSFSVDVVQETLSRTNLSYLRRGSKVNIELPIEVGGRLDGHILEGHIDGMGTIVSLRRSGMQTILRVRLPTDLRKYVVENGSIGIDGVSLTVKKIDRNIVSTALVPFTVDNTTFARRPRGERVNIEVDRMGKYLEQQLINRGHA